MASWSSYAKLPVKRLVGALKGVSLAGDASVHPMARIKGPGRVTLASGARIGARASIDLRGGTFALGEGSAIPGNVVIRVGDRIRVGADTTIMYYTVIYGEGGVSIGDRVLLGNHCLVASTTHRHDERGPIIEQGMRVAPVVISNDVWVGAYTLIDPGVTIGEGAIIAAHSYIREDVPPYAVVGGVPAKVLKMRAEERHAG